MAQDGVKGIFLGVILAIVLVGGALYATGNLPLRAGAGATGAATQPSYQPPSAPAAAVSAGCTDMRQIAIDSEAQDAQAGSFVTSGADLYFYNTAKLPSDPTANATRTTAVTTQIAAGPIKTCTPYYALFTDATGTATYYDMSYFGVKGTGKNREPISGQIQPPSGVTAATLSTLVSFSGDKSVHQNATIAFPINISAAKVNGNSNSSLQTNGGATPTAVVGCTSASGTGDATGICPAIGAETISNATLTVNLSASGAGSWFLDYTIEAKGGNKALQGLVLCAGTNINGAGGMDGNEFTSITAQWRSGRDYYTKGALVSELVNVWKNDQCVRLFQSDAEPWLNGGESGEVRFTFTTTTANWDGGETFKLCLDDLYDMNGKDLRLGTGAASQCLTIAGAKPAAGQGL